MFEFGRDLRKLFAQARESEDLGWVELIGVDLLAVEARREATDAGRVSCAHPFETERRACALWREHARRSGAADSLTRAARCADSLTRIATDETQAARAAVEVALTVMLRFDLCGGPEHLRAGLRVLEGVGRPRRAQDASAASAVHARLTARLARLGDNSDALLDAAALMDVALHGARGDHAIGHDDLRLDRAALALEAGVMQRDPRLLDQAGRDLAALIEAASPDHRPLTRARALALCGAGLGALAAVADDEVARRQGRDMFDAAAENFTPDHSPMDWATIQILRGDDETQSLMTLAQAEALTQGEGLVVGALARLTRTTREVALAEAVADRTALGAIRDRLLARLEVYDARLAPLDWVADQIGLARVALGAVRLGDAALPRLGLILAEAAATAREMGVPVLAEQAEGLARADAASAV